MTDETRQPDPPDAPPPAPERVDPRSPWQSFGVPHGGAPEAPAYTPAMRERPRTDLTQPIDTGVPAGEHWSEGPPQGARDGMTQGTTQEPVVPSAREGSWWSSPGDLGGTPELGPQPGAPRSSVLPGDVPGDPWSGHGADRTGTQTAQTGTPTSALPYAGEPAGAPAGGAAPWAAHPSPSGAATSTFGPPVPSGWDPAPGGPPGSGYPGGPGTPTGPGSPGGPGIRAPEGRRRFAALAALAVVAALLGGGVALAGQQLLSRGTTLGSAVPAPGPGSTARPDGSIAKIAADALPSVVTIRIKTAQGSGTGSGFVIDNQGHILTNNHVVAAAGGNGTISVELNNGKTLPATVVGTDVSYDLAVIKVEATDLPALQFGASKDVVVGDGVIAVGAPLGLDATVTSGIVSALNRPVTPGDGSDQSFINAIQTDAAINPGNSGGPLLDMNGRVIGINSAIARIPGSTSDSGGNIGVGFAIPSDQAAKTAQQLITTGKADHPALGVSVDRSYTGDGAKIAAGGVKSGTAADKAGLREGDVVTEFEGRKVTDADSLIVAVRAKSVGDTVTMKVQRGNQTLDLSLALQSASS